MENQGALVDLFDERPSNSFFTKAILRIKKELYTVKINEYFKAIIEKIKDYKYDYFLLIKGEATPAFFLEFIKSNNPGIKFIFYTYDSFNNNSNGFGILKYFDYKYTFDSKDAVKYKMKFRPLFFAPDYGLLNQIDKKFDYDLAFIGTAHSDRYMICESARNWCEKNNFTMFTYYFSPSKTLFKFKKLTEKDFRTFDPAKISFRSLKHKEIVDIYKKSKVILDITHKGQNGLTMRTFETLGAGRKLITTNPEIKTYPFYDPQNIWVIERGNVQFDKKFFETDFKEINDQLRQTMSLEGWVNEIFTMKNPGYWDTVLEHKI
ncbi:hypothetical protein [Kaistella polysaccharea]|uniref:hypothetical protein n=1 Tax=Kaistella polysaccharea TaxID=2878534 RepID=UPI001CF3B39B|nr:hypothetical protein [Kaistella polysaccharea]